MKRVRRGGDSKKNHVIGHCATSLKIFSANCASLRNGKMGSLNAEVRATQSNIVTLQETHFTEKGKIKLDKQFVVFEAIRPKKGGGTAIAVHEDLKPKLIEEYSDSFELLVVEIETQNKSVRVISGYGPQENWEEEKRLPFFITLEKEIDKAELAGVSTIVEIDANSKLGKENIDGDPHDTSPNGVLLADIIKRHNLILGNGNIRCTGTITRKRVTKDRIEQSVIDIVMFSSDLQEYLVAVSIDEERKHILSKISKTKKGVKVKESDHNTILTEFNLKVIANQPKEKIEVYNLKNKDCQNAFKEYTSKTNMLSSIFDKGDDNIDNLTDRLLKKINGCVAASFKKRRVVVNKNTKVETLYDRMRALKGKEDSRSKTELDEVMKKIADNAENNFKKLKKELDGIKADSGKLDKNKLWKLRKKMCPKIRDPPTAMMDRRGNVLTSEKAISERAIEVYEERLTNNDMKSHLTELETDTNKLCELRLEISKKNATDPWTMEDLKLALKQLHKDRSADPDGFINELFKEAVAGDDLLLAILKLMNKIKTTQKYPKNFEK